jgi:hypothetical protein
MHLKSRAVCQFLKGSPDGAQCSVVSTFIRLMEDADIRLCMGRHHEACSYYVYSLRRLALSTSGPDSVLGTL